MPLVLVVQDILSTSVTLIKQYHLVQPLPPPSDYVKDYIYRYLKRKFSVASFFAFEMKMDLSKVKYLADRNLEDSHISKF